MSDVAYTTVPGFFIQDDPNAVGSVVGALPPRFGLLDASADRWTTFTARIDALNGAAEDGAVHKVFWLGRHGQGYHNVAEAKYGTEAWDAHWSKLTGDGALVWGPDPLLTPLGEAQADAAAAAWAAELPHGVPPPERCLCSPHRRALDTWARTFASATRVLPEERRRVLIMEDCREEYGVHTCDMRSPRAALAARYPPPTYAFEPGFAETDPLWTPDARESREHRVARARRVLDAAFAGPGTYISITAHGGFINGFLNAVGRPDYGLPTGGVLPVVVKRTPQCSGFDGAEVDGGEVL